MSDRVKAIVIDDNGTTATFHATSPGRPDFAITLSSGGARESVRMVDGKTGDEAQRVLRAAIASLKGDRLGQSISE